MSNIVKIEAKYQIRIDTLKVWLNGMLFSFSGVFEKGNTGYTKRFNHGEYCYVISGCASEGKLNFVDFYLFEAPTKEEINFNKPILFIENISI